MPTQVTIFLSGTGVTYQVLPRQKRVRLKSPRFLWLLLHEKREYQKDVEFRLHHCLSKFDWSVFLNLKPFFFICVYMAWYLRKIHFNFCGKFELNSLFSCYNCIQPGLLILRMIAIAGPFSVPSCLLHYCQPLLLRSRLSRALYIMGYLHCFCQPICQKMGWQQQAIFKVKHSDCMFELSRFALQKNSNSCARALSFFCLQYLGSITLFFY